MSSTMLCYSLALWAMTSIATFAHAFIASDVPYSNTVTMMCTRPAGILLHSQNNPSDDNIMGDDNNDEEDESLLDELRNTKKDMFGAEIPTNEELQDAAQNAENAFLSAMLDQTQQFQRLKSEEGSEKAVDLFMERMQIEDEATGSLEREGVDDEGGCDDDSIKNKWFVKQMQLDSEESVRLGETDDESNDEAWQ